MTTTQLDHEIKAAREKLTLLEKARAAALEDVSNCSAGDLVVYSSLERNRDMTLGNVYELIEIEIYDSKPLCRILDDVGDRAVYYADKFRRANAAEITKHENEVLLNEAAKQGFVPGAAISYESLSGTIGSLYVYRGGPVTGISVAVQSFFQETQKPFIVIEWGPNSAVPMARCKLVSHIKLTVAGNDYIAEFRPGRVVFGCAEIDNELFKQAYQLVNLGNLTKGNRAVESIQIGQGVFSAELIKKIYPLLK